MSIVLLIVVAVVGVGAATLLMWMCAKLAGVEEVSVRSSLIAACGFGLPLAGAAQTLRSGVSVPLGLGLLAASVGIGLWIIRTAYGTSWGKALVTWVMHLCAWVILGALMWRARG